MASAGSSPMQHGARFCVKNTFIDTCVDDEQPRNLPRRHTEPLMQQLSFETDAGISLESLSSNSSVESWSDDDGDRQELAEEGPVTLPIPRVQGPFQGHGLQLMVKNTFISLEENCEESPVRCCCRTVPAKGSDLFEVTEEEIDRCFFSDPDVSPASKETSTRSFASFTPTPWATEMPAEHLRFLRPVPSQPMRMTVPVPSQQPALTESQCFSFPCAPATPMPLPGILAPPLAVQSSQVDAEKVTICARDKSLAVSHVGSGCRVQWRVDAKKLRSSDKQVVSPPLEVSLQHGAAAATFKVMLYPKGGSSFKKSGGVGHVQLKCCSDLQEDTQPASLISVSVGRGRAAQGPRGPFPHKFGSSSVFSMPKEQADWDFGACVEASGLFFTIAVVIAPHA